MSLVYETYEFAKASVGQGEPSWRPFDAGLGNPLEQLEDPEGVLHSIYSNGTWQNRTFDAARSVALGTGGGCSISV